MNTVLLENLPVTQLHNEFLTHYKTYTSLTLSQQLTINSHFEQNASISLSNTQSLSDKF